MDLGGIQEFVDFMSFQKEEQVQADYEGIKHTVAFWTSSFFLSSFR